MSADVARVARAPTLTLPRKRERGPAYNVADARSSLQALDDKVITRNKHGLLPLPLAGEGWGGGIYLWTNVMSEEPKPAWKVPSRIRANAKSLRKNSTDVERILWSELRDHRLNGFAFRRQVPIANSVADFACHAAKLVIELDGGQHFSDDGEIADARRTATIESKGFRVLRFSNHDVMTNRTGVLETIASELATRAPTPTLPRKRERGQAACPADASTDTGKPTP